MLLETATKPAHTHKFEINNKGLGKCPCGEVRKYIYSTNMKENRFETVQLGDPDYKDPVVPASPFMPAKPAENITNSIYQNEQIEAGSNPQTVTRPAEKLTGSLTKANLPQNSLTKVNEPPLKRRGGNTAERHLIIEKNKDEIILDVATLGKKKALLKWNISPSGWLSIKKRWGLNSEPAETKKKKGMVINKEFEDNLPPPKKETEAAAAPEKKPTPNRFKVIYLVDYWRKRAKNNNTSDSEAVVMNLTADVLEVMG